VSGFIKKMLPMHLDRQFPQHMKNAVGTMDEELTHLTTVFTSAYLHLNSDLLKRPTIDSSFSGSTAVSVLIRGNLAIGANAGDSRAILGKKSDGVWTAVPLSNDHKPDNSSEQSRIQRCGGRVEPFKGNSHPDETGRSLGPARVWLRGEQIPGLAMSRSIGDSVAAQVGVISEPEVLQVELTREHKFLILASDGVWEFISSQAVGCM
jgi:serine/threonine protein phosphatase PrpC